MSLTSLRLVITQSTFPKIFRCSWFSEFDGKISPNMTFMWFCINFGKKGERGEVKLLQSCFLFVFHLDHMSGLDSSAFHDRLMTR